MSALRPIGGQILIREAKAASEVLAGGIYVPNQQSATLEGVIEGLGSGRRDERGRVFPFDVKIGDKVLFNRYAGIRASVGDDQYVLVTQDDVFGVLES